MPKLKGPDPLVPLSVKVPESLFKRLDKAAAAWGVDRTAIVRRAIEDGMASWQQEEVRDSEALALLRFIRDRTLTTQAMLNLTLANRIDDAWLAQLEDVKQRIRNGHTAE
jgi:predicted transcriptional regulator